jgi:hypothetical protein
MKSISSNPNCLFLLCIFHAIPLLTLTSGWSFNNHHKFSSTSKQQQQQQQQQLLQGRRQVLLNTIETYTKACLVATTTTILPPAPMVERAWGRNLPESTGADLSSTGTIMKLIPILKIKSSLEDAQKIIVLVDNATTATATGGGGGGGEKQLIGQQTRLKVEMTNAIQSIPTNEKQFKRIFDEYSDPVSYKQKYMDANAFLIYYTNGYDGPNRESIEKQQLGDDNNSMPKQTLQYGARNDIWTSFEELLVEIQFADDSSTTTNDILGPLVKVIQTLDVYLSYAPKEDVERANMQLQ